MAGGNWTAQNKVRPGIYINFTTRGSQTLTLGSRGTAAICRPLSWGPPGEIMTIDAGADTTAFIGWGITTEQARFLREMFKGTDVTGGPTKVLLYRPEAAGAAAASAALGDITVTALYPGLRGNGISIVSAEDIDEAGTYTVTTLVDGKQADLQRVKTAGELSANSWVKFSGTGPLSATAGVTLSGGADGTADASAYAAFLEALEPYSFDVLAYDGTDSTVNQALIAFVKRISAQEGRYSQLVTTGAEKADSIFVINCKSGVVLEDGTALTPQETVWWLAGAQAGAQYWQSLTYAAYPGAVDVTVKRTGTQIEQEILAGSIVLAQEFDAVRIETDVNTQTTSTPEFGPVFGKNLTMRVCSSLANDLYREFSQNYLGKVKHDPAGRGLFQAAILGYLKTMYEKGALRARPEAADVTVEQGGSADSIVIAIALLIAGAVEKIYLTVTVR